MVLRERYFLYSMMMHAFFACILMFNFHFGEPPAVVENSHKNDVISAVILGDTPNSKVLPKEESKIIPPTPKPEIKSVPPPPVKAVPKVAPSPTKRDVIVLKPVVKKKIEKVAEVKKINKDILAKNLLADIEKNVQKNKQAAREQQAKLKAQFQKTLREQAEKTLRQQLLNEQVKLRAQQLRLTQGIVNKYKALIIQAISEHWLVPPQANKKLYCELMIRIAPGGMVLDVQITKTSGDRALDNSARAAVLKASPLPVPSETEAFETFRQFVLKVKPENVLGYKKEMQRTVLAKR